MVESDQPVPKCGVRHAQAAISSTLLSRPIITGWVKVRGE